MHQRLDLAEAALRERAQLSDIDAIKQEVKDEFEIVLAQMPYLGGARRPSGTDTDPCPRCEPLPIPVRADRAEMGPLGSARGRPEDLIVQAS